MNYYHKSEFQINKLTFTAKEFDRFGANIKPIDSETIELKVNDVILLNEFCGAYAKGLTVNSSLGQDVYMVTPRYFKTIDIKKVRKWKSVNERFNIMLNQSTLGELRASKIR